MVTSTEKPKISTTKKVATTAVKTAPAAKKTATKASTAVKKTVTKPLVAPPAPTSALQGMVPPTASDAVAAVGDALSPIVAENDLRKKELFDLVVARSGMKKKDVKPVVEAMLEVLGDALAEQRELVLPPLGKIKIQRAKELPQGRALILKLRQKQKPSEI